jgi:hypothetical protein
MTFSPSFSADPFVFYTGTRSSTVAVPFTVSLDGRTFGVDFRDYRRSSLASLRDSVISTGQVDDALFNTDGAWWRYRHDWSYGAGQSVMDLGQDRDPRRFDESVGINPWVESELTLHHATSLATDLVKTTRTLIVVTSGFLYVGDAAKVYRTADMATWTEITGLSGTFNGMTTDGVDVYIATSTRLYKVTPASAAAASFVNKAHDDVWFAGDILFGAQGAVLVTVAANGNETTVATHFQSTFKWSTVFAVGSKVYAGGTAGSKSEIYGFTVNSSGGLVRGAEVVSLSIGEKVNEVISHVGNVIFCTTKGVRLGTVSQDGTLSYGPLIEAPGSVVQAVAEGRYVWFTWPVIETGKTGIGRLDLSTTPRTLQPAYATDLFAEVSGNCDSVGRYMDRMVFGVPGSGIHVENPTAFVTEGYLTSGDVYFGTVETKLANDFRANFEQLDDNEGVRVELFDSRASLLKASGVSQPNLDTLELQLDGEFSDYFGVVVRLQSDGTSTPKFERWRLRSFPVVPAVEQFVVPLLLYANVVINDSQGQLYSSDVSEELAYIEKLWKRKNAVSFVEGKNIYRVRIEAYEFQPREWSDSNNGLEGTLVVRLVTI